ncbi:MAG: hypothetical protein GY791_15310 [Alphaproteobacteria bacterium]|nr:hypothetical protein [Alphaproteobacteria bacterium]
MFVAICAAAGAGLASGVALACTPTNDGGAECISAGGGRVVAIEDNVVRELSFSNICETDLIVTYEWAGDFISRKSVPAGGSAKIRCNGAVCTGEITWGAVCEGETGAGKIAALSVTGPAVALEQLDAEEETESAQQAAAPETPASQEQPAAAPAPEVSEPAPEVAEAAPEVADPAPEVADPAPEVAEAAPEAAAPPEPTASPPEALPAVAEAADEAPWEEGSTEAADSAETTAEAAAEKPPVVAEAPPQPAITPTLRPSAEERIVFEQELAAEPTAEAISPPAPVEEVQVAAVPKPAVPKTVELDIPTQKIQRSPVKDGATPTGISEPELDKLLIGRWRANGKADLECEVQSTSGTISIKERQAPFFYVGNAVVETEVDVKDGCQLKTGWPNAWTYESDISLSVHGDDIRIVWHKVTERNPGGTSHYALKDGKLVAIGERSRADGMFEEVLSRR